MFTVEEAAQLLRISPSYIRKLLNLNLLECVDMGTCGRRIPRFTLPALQRFIAERSHRGDSSPDMGSIPGPTDSHHCEGIVAEGAERDQAVEKDKTDDLD